MDDKSTVYVVQQPMKRDQETGELVPRFDISPASAYGNIEFLLNDGRAPLNPAPMIHTMRQKLKDFGDEDYLLPMGDPTAMAAATMLASQYNQGRVNVLRWDRQTRQYIKVRLSIAPEERESVE
jgi:hypothetical protein